MEEKEFTLMNDGHNHGKISSEVRLFTVLVLTLIFMVVEIIIGLLSNSLALLSDAGHMANDAFSLILALVAVRIGYRKKNVNFTFGYKRIEIIAAFVNGLALCLVAGYIILEAGKRFLKLEDLIIDGELMIYGSMGGLLINLGGIFILSRGEGQNLNIKAAIHHVLADLMGSVGAVISAIGIILFGWFWLDLATSIIISLLILRSAYLILRESTGILAESSPKEIDTKSLLIELHKVPGVLEIHDFHTWKLADQNNLITAHFLVDDRLDSDTLRLNLERVAKSYGFDHVTFQIERVNCMDEDGNCVMKEEGFITHT